MLKKKYVHSWISSIGKMRPFRQCPQRQWNQLLCLRSSEYLCCNDPMVLDDLPDKMQDTTYNRDRQVQLLAAPGTPNHGLFNNKFTYLFIWICSRMFVVKCILSIIILSSPHHNSSCLVYLNRIHVIGNKKISDTVCSTQKYTEQHKSCLGLAYTP